MLQYVLPTKILQKRNRQHFVTVHTVEPYSRKGDLNCYVHTQLFLALYMCVFSLNGFPLWLFLELDSLLWNIVLEVSGLFTI